MKKIIAIYHPELKQELIPLSKIQTKHSHIFYSTFWILKSIAEKTEKKEFSTQIDFCQLKLQKPEIVYSNNQLIFRSNDTEIKSKKDLNLVGMTEKKLFEMSEIRLFLHEIEEYLVKSSTFPVIFETTSFIHPTNEVSSILLCNLSAKTKQLNPASLFVDLFTKNYLDIIKKYITEPEYVPSLQFTSVDYCNFFINTPHNKSIETIRPSVKKIISELRMSKLFDDFDLEIQTLAASTLFDPNELVANEPLLKEIIEDELTVIEHRYALFKDIIPVKDLLTPKSIFKAKTRYWLNNDRIFAVPTGKKGADKSQAVEVGFKLVEKQLALDFVECFHYIHNRHDFDLAFGFFIKGEKYPYAISLVERTGQRLYKTEFLHQSGINPLRTFDEIRLYSLPWCPMTTSSVLSYKVREYLQENLPNITHTITAVNRNIFSGTYIQQAGYIPLALKPAKFGFKEFKQNGKFIPYYNGSDPGLARHSIQTLLPTVEYYRPIRSSDLVETNGEVFVITYDQYQM